MNERIRELAKLADPEFTGNGGYGAGDCLVGLAAVEKFAELIVQKCAELAQYLVDHGHDDIADAIKDRFGVER